MSIDLIFRTLAHQEKHTDTNPAHRSFHMIQMVATPMIRDFYEYLTDLFIEHCWRDEINPYWFPHCVHTFVGTNKMGFIGLVMHVFRVMHLVIQSLDRSSVNPLQVHLTFTHCLALNEKSSVAMYTEIATFCVCSKYGMCFWRKSLFHIL